MPEPEAGPRLFAIPGWMRKHTPVLTRLIEQLAAVRVLDCATRLAAQAFLGGLPALFVVGTIGPDWMQDQLVSSLRAAMGLQDAALDQVLSVYAAKDPTTVTTTSAVGIIVTLASATACSRALQRTCERCWHLPKAKAAVAAWRWLAWLTVWLAALLFQGPLQNAFGTGAVTGFLLAVVSGTLLWWWTQHLLLGARIPWLPLLPGAVLAGTGEQLLTVASKVYMPRTLNRSVDEFGSLGAVFVVLSWLITLFVVITLAIALGYVAAHEHPLARWLRTPPRPAPAKAPEPAAG
ncbi:YhjD/YihY/BrkB family envelope integrity protein [Streptomyces sp. SPB4]|uniref:YhjD/YihY/BrkB family envelope integrity protein n=1 Tax=Streptomyces sp. SPB4 TaxID=2940553 RepID=UPI002472EC97|nr:YhjD/YihY/BrkB family envelope integrity protein [Streptomyces sp. SPB4]MDH6542514.1 membrane protein [Streptomyces sp. SPB4]